MWPDLEEPLCALVEDALGFVEDLGGEDGELEFAMLVERLKDMRDRVR